MWQYTTFQGQLSHIIPMVCPLMMIFQRSPSCRWKLLSPWYAHIANYLVTGEVPSEWKAQDKKHFFAKIHTYYQEEPFLFKYYADQIIRKCIPEQEQQGILSHCHKSACGGHFASQKTAMKVLQLGFCWPSLFKDALTMCKSCDRCQRLGKLMITTQKVLFHSL